MQRKIPTGYSVFPDEAQASLKAAADKFFKPSFEGFPVVPEGYTRVTDLLSEKEKADLEKHHIATEQSFKKFSAY